MRKLSEAWTAGRKSEEHPLRSALWDIGRERPTTGVVFLLLVLAAAAYSVMNTLGNLLSLRCMNVMDASVQFPLLSATVTVLTISSKDSVSIRRSVLIFVLSRSRMFTSVRA